VTTEALAGLEVADADADVLLVAPDMGSRKDLIIGQSDAFVVLPGGLGTLDELFEVWTTAALGVVHHKPIVLLDPEGFYDHLLKWLAPLVATGFVKRTALEKLIVAKSVDDALDAIDHRVRSGQQSLLDDL
jgi:uncharacterized protein (TIGR00730 family)